MTLFHQSNNLKPKVLIVDDEYDNCLQIGYSLKDHFELVYCYNGVEALEKCRNHQFKALVIDQRMPEMTGAELCYHLVEMNYPASRILITAYEDYEELINAINEGKILRFLMKPLDKWQLVSAVMEAVELTDSRERIALEKKEIEKKLHRAEQLSGYYEDYLTEDQISTAQRKVEDNIANLDNSAHLKLFPSFYVSFDGYDGELEEDIVSLMNDLVGEYSASLVARNGGDLMISFDHREDSEASQHALDLGMAMVSEFEGLVRSKPGFGDLESLIFLIMTEAKGESVDQKDVQAQIIGQVISSGLRDQALDRMDQPVQLFVAESLYMLTNGAGLSLVEFVDQMPGAANAIQKFYLHNSEL